MQAALFFTPPFLPPKPPKTQTILWSSPSKNQVIKATPVSNDTSSVDYSSKSSVFPAEACETIGGEACDAEIYPEVKLKQQEDASTKPKTASELVDREYVEYNDLPKTVFPAEACDDLGGEFCEPEYQKGVY